MVKNGCVGDDEANSLDDQTVPNYLVAMHWGRGSNL